MMTSNEPTTLTDLGPRFQQPEGWRWHHFTNVDGRKLRFGTVYPKSRIPDAVIVCLPGLSEFAEKYFEFAHDLLDRNLGLWILDWEGQGKSDRHLPDRQKRHAVSFDQDISDLHGFILEYVKHACVHPDVGRLPMAMVAHSMGSNIGMRYLIRHPDMFACAAFSSPMVQIAGAKALPGPIAVIVSWFLKLLLNTQYLFGSGPWSQDDRDLPEHNIFSSDPVRHHVHNIWCKTDTLLQVGGVTFGWLHAALKSCAALKSEMKRKPVEIPCLLALAGHEALVDNQASHKIAKMMKNATILDLPESRHEILMERNEIRNAFFTAFEALLAEHKIREKLKRF